MQYLSAYSVHEHWLSRETKMIQTGLDLKERVKAFKNTE